MTPRLTAVRYTFSNDKVLHYVYPNDKSPKLELSKSDIDPATVWYSSNETAQAAYMSLFPDSKVEEEEEEEDIGYDVIPLDDLWITAREGSFQ